MNFLVPLVEGR